MTNLELKTVISVMELSDKALEHLDKCYHLCDFHIESIISDALRSYDLFTSLCSVLDYECSIRGIDPRDDFDE